MGFWTFSDSIRSTSYLDSTVTLGNWGRRWDAENEFSFSSTICSTEADLSNEAVTWIAGLHAMYDTRSGIFTAEPRLGIQYVTESGVVKSAGSGLHSQAQSPYIYASATATEATGPLNMPNQNLGFNRVTSTT